MAQRNYLPFIRRQRLDIPVQVGAGTIQTSFSSIPGLATGGGIRTYLTDACIAFDYSSSAQVGLARFLMRMGITGQSYFTERFYPIGSYFDGTIKETGCWRFAKPYRLFPGERLKVQETYTFQPEVWPGVIFSGKRLDNDEPILLYQTQDMTRDTSTSFLFNTETLRCPAETPIDLYAVTTNIPRTLLDINAIGVGNADEYPTLMIWGPDGRQWWNDSTWRNLLHMDTHVIDLQKPEYELMPEQALVFEFQRTGADASARAIWITIRGSYEVLV